MSSLILPGHPLFDLTLAEPPPNWWDAKKMETEVALVADSETGLLRPVNLDELNEYLYGGEYQERLETNGND